MAPSASSISSESIQTQGFSSSGSSFDFKKHPLLKTFYISENHIASKKEKIQCGKDIIKAIRDDGIINISITGLCSSHVINNAFATQKQFFDMPTKKKLSCFNEYSYGGYVYSGEEETAGKKDAAEIFTVTPDICMDDWKVKTGIPCHGTVPWPFGEFENSMKKYMETMNDIGTQVLRLIALGLDMREDAFDGLTESSWGHMRVLKFCERSKSELKGIGSHTDYGMLVLAAQDHVGGLWVRPPGNDKRNANWKESSAGKFESAEDADGWKFVVPECNVLTCFPGDMLQFITDGQLLSTPHKVDLADEERYALAYFHEPSFGAIIRKEDSGEEIHYGEHFTNMFLRCYPEKPVSRRIKSHELLKNLPKSVTGTFSF